MTEEFKVGELVRCIDPVDSLVKGELYPVEGVNSWGICVKTRTITGYWYKLRFTKDGVDQPKPAPLIKGENYINMLVAYKAFVAAAKKCDMNVAEADYFCQKMTGEKLT